MTSYIKDKRLLLQPKHFIEGRTKLEKTGLCFAHKIHTVDRDLEVFNMTRQDVDTFLEAIANNRPYTVVVLNPMNLSATALLDFLKQCSKNLMVDNGIPIDYGLPEKYDLQWQRYSEDGFDKEGQQLVLVAFASNGKEPVGYLGFNLVINQDAQDPHLVLLLVELNLIYVIPSHRGQGYGMDLSISCSYVCQDILTAVYRAAPPNTDIHTTIYADYESCGGEDCANQIKSSLDYCVDMLRESGKRRSVKLDYPELDAGF